MLLIKLWCRVPLQITASYLTAILDGTRARFVDVTIQVDQPSSLIEKYSNVKSRYLPHRHLYCIHCHQ